MSQTELYLISVAARMLDMHPQTLRKYERLGLVRPIRTGGSMRVYTRTGLDRLRLIKQLVDEDGINLAGVRRLLSIAEAVGKVRPLLREPAARQRPDDLRRQVAQQLDEIARILGV